MREILVYDDYEIHKLGAGGGTQYEEVTTEKATSIYVTDVAKTKGKLIPFGRTYQKQLEGYNLFDYAQVVNLAYGTKQDASGNYILQNKKYRGYYIQVDPNVTYIISRKSTTDFSRFRVCCTEVLPVANVPVISESIVNGDGLTDLIKTIPENGHYLFLYLSNNDEDITPEMEIQITKSEELLPYEPYVGGQASPSPDFPQEIQNVEGRSCTNLFNKNTIETGYRIIWSSGLPYADETARASDYIEIKNDVEYSCNQKVYIIGYDQHKEYVGALTNQGFVKSTGSTYEHFTITDTSIKYIKVMGYGTSEATAGLFNINTFQLNEGSTALPYEEYFEGKRLEFNVCNKNLVEVSAANSIGYPNYMHYTIDDLKKEVNITGSTLMGFKCKVKPNTEYTVHYLLTSFGSEGNKKLRVREYSSEPIEWAGGNFIQQRINETIVDTNPKKTFTTSETTEWILLLIYIETAAVGNGVTASNWQVAEGLDDSFVEHNQQLIPFPLADGQKLMEGDYLAEDGVHHIRGKVVLNGTETWNKYEAIDTDNYYGYRVDAPVDMKLPPDSITLTNYDCDKFTEISWNSMLHIGNRPAFAIRYDNARVYIHAPFATIAELTEWLSNNNMTIEYDLTQEVIDTYTEEQAKAYNKLKNLMLYKGVNHIWTNTDGLEPNLQLTYKRVKQEGVLQVSNIQQLNNLELNNTEETPEEITTEISEE